MAISVFQLSSKGVERLGHSTAEVRRLLQDAALTEELSAPLREALGLLFGHGAEAELLRLRAMALEQGAETAGGFAKDFYAALSSYGLSGGTIPGSEALMAASAIVPQPIVASRLGETTSPTALQLRQINDTAGNQEAISSTWVPGNSPESQPLAMEFGTFPGTFQDIFQNEVRDIVPPAPPAQNSAPETPIAPLSFDRVAPVPPRASAIDAPNDAIEVEATQDNPGMMADHLPGGAGTPSFKRDVPPEVVGVAAAPDVDVPGEVNANDVSAIPVVLANPSPLDEPQETSATVHDLSEAMAYGSRMATVSPTVRPPNINQVSQIAAGETITWTYSITNSGNTAFNRFQFIDDNGTAGNTTDDLTLELAPNGTLTSNGIIFQGGDRNGNGIFDVAEVWTFTVRDVAQDLSVSINFDETVVNAAGESITDQYDSAEFGLLEVSTPGTPFGAMIFDSANPTGGDFDLRTPTTSHGTQTCHASGMGIGNITAQNNVLIISEDGDSLDPDDHAGGGTLRFNFSEQYGVALDAVSLLDIDATEKKVTAQSFLDRQLITSQAALPLGDNSFQRLELPGEIATSLEINFVHSGAVTQLEYRRIFGKTATFIAATNGEVLNQSISSFYTNPLGNIGG